MAKIARARGQEPRGGQRADSTLIATDERHDYGGRALGRQLPLGPAGARRSRRTFSDETSAPTARRSGSLDFASPDAPARINDWVAEKTNDKITKIVDQIDQSAILFLINAIYFKGTWTKEFDKDLTREEHLLSSRTAPSKPRPMMRQSGRIRLPQGRRIPGGAPPLRRRTHRHVRLPARRADSSLDRFQEGLSAKAGTPG